MSAKLGEGRVGAPVGAKPIGWGWRLFFWVAAIFNFVIGLMGIFSSTSSVDERIIGLLVACFGIIYALVARDPRRFLPALWAGLFGKIGVVTLLGPIVFGPGGDVLIAGVLTCDAIFALGFLIFLLIHRRDSWAESRIP